jgi:superfamily I DNA/RNA helicase
MHKLDDFHRTYVSKHIFKKGDVVAIQSVAGSGKTTTLLNLAKIHKNKRILYIAFNKSLITEIKQKVYCQGIKNMFPMTFDSLLYQMHNAIRKEDPTIITLRPQNVADYVPWLKGKPYRLKSSIIRQYNQFCNDPAFNSMEDYCTQTFSRRKPILEQLWAEAEKGSFHTFENLRKLAQKEHWFNPYIDNTYDMIMVDETQDFDMNMLRMLLDDTTIPKLFVGDPKQSIYEFRGCINAFLHMPENALNIEFYSTFRVGNPACGIIRKQFSNCWMISKSKHTTALEPYTKWLNKAEAETEQQKPNQNPKPKPYTYLFRSWKGLLTAAANQQRVWINSYDKKCEEIRNMHKKLAFTFSLDEEFEDDLPKFLKSITSYELDNLLATIEGNMVDKKDALVQMYTVHSYKGLEDEIVRLADDIERGEETIYYVALTRGFKHILTPMDIEYFEKLIAKEMSDQKIEEKAEKTVKAKAPTCVCGGCTNKDHFIGIFDTAMGKKHWCVDCSRHPCKCFD